MKICKKKSLKLNDSSTYTLNKIGEYFLINKLAGSPGDNYAHQFVLIDKYLKIVAKPINYEGDISIYQTFPCDDRNRFLTYSADPYFLLYGDFSKNLVFTIDISDLSDKYFLPIYKWTSNNIILITSKDNFYDLDILAKNIKPITENCLKASHRDLYDFWEKTHKKKPAQADFVNQNYMYTENYLKFDGSTQNIVQVDLKNNQVEKIIDPLDNHHDVIFHKGYFVIVAEKMLTVIKNGEEICAYPMEDRLYIFARICGIGDAEGLAFIALEFCQGGRKKKDRLVRYELVSQVTFNPKKTLKKRKLRKN